MDFVSRMGTGICIYDVLTNLWWLSWFLNAYTTSMLCSRYIELDHGGLSTKKKMVLSCIIPLYGYVIPQKIGLLRTLLELCLSRWLDGHLSHPWRPSAASLVAGGLGPWAARSSAPIFFLEISTSFAESWGVLSNFLRTPKKYFMGRILKNQVMYCIWRPHGSAAGVGWNMPWHSTRQIQEWMLHIKRNSYMVNWFSEMSELFLSGLCTMLRTQENSDPSHFFTSHC